MIHEYDATHILLPSKPAEADIDFWPSSHIDIYALWSYNIPIEALHIYQHTSK